MNKRLTRRVEFDENTRTEGIEITLVETRFNIEPLYAGTYPLGGTEGWYKVAPLTKEMAYNLVFGDFDGKERLFLNKGYVVYANDGCYEYAIYQHDWSYMIIRREID